MSPYAFRRFPREPFTGTNSRKPVEGVEGSSMGFKHDHFSSVASEYADFRPHYPRDLFTWLATLPTRHALAWDAGTGNGQAAIELPSSFERVIATDPSPTQIAAATTHPRIEYRVAAAESSGLETGSADLITVAQALHWFDLDAFYREATRVMAPGGCIAVWTYGIFHCDQPDIDRELQRFYTEEAGPFWPPNRRLVETGYRTIPFPFTEMAVPSFRMEAEWGLMALLGYIGTWSAVTRLREAIGSDPIEKLSRELAPMWGDPNQRRVIGWPLSVRAGRL